jgi:ABC-type multidrug transport system ATPase subunit
MIRIDKVSKRFGRAVAVDGVSFDVAAGDSVALWGVNGAGKTTLIRCVLGLLRFRGRIEVGGFDVRRRGKRARMLMGYVPQELGFYDDLGVAEAVRFFARLKRVSVKSVGDVLAGVGLAGHERKRIRELSGGMKQRLALAIAMLGDPPVLVLDEVTASLDAVGRREFVALLSRLSGSGRTVIFASHRVEEVATLARRVITLEKGKIVNEATSERFVENLGLNTVLHVKMKPDACQPAIDLLRDSGFQARMNGHGVLVPVQREHKGTPLRLLADARITVDDFDLVTAAAMQSMAGHGDEPS